MNEFRLRELEALAFKPGLTLEELFRFMPVFAHREKREGSVFDRLQAEARRRGRHPYRPGEGLRAENALEHQPEHRPGLFPEHRPPQGLVPAAPAERGHQDPIDAAAHAVHLQPHRRQRVVRLRHDQPQELRRVHPQSLRQCLPPGHGPGPAPRPQPGRDRRPRHGRLLPRPGQARDPPGDPEQAGQARRRRARDHGAAPVQGRREARPPPGIQAPAAPGHPRGHGAPHQGGPVGLSALLPQGRRQSVQQDRQGRRFLRRHHDQARLPDQRLHPGRGPEPHARAVRHGVQSRHPQGLRQPHGRVPHRLARGPEHRRDRDRLRSQRRPEVPAPPDGQAHHGQGREQDRRRARRPHRTGPGDGRFVRTIVSPLNPHDYGIEIADYFLAQAQ